MVWAYFLGIHFIYLGAFSNLHLSPKILICLLGPSGNLHSEIKAVTDESVIGHMNTGKAGKKKVEYHLEEHWFFFRPLKNDSNRHRVLVANNLNLNVYIMFLLF